MRSGFLKKAWSGFILSIQTVIIVYLIRYPVLESVKDFENIYKTCNRDILEKLESDKKDINSYIDFSFSKQIDSQNKFNSGLNSETSTELAAIKSSIKITNMKIDELTSGLNEFIELLTAINKNLDFKNKIYVAESDYYYINRFEEGLNHYNTGDYFSAYNSFDELTKNGDKSSRTYLYKTASNFFTNPGDTGNYDLYKKKLSSLIQSEILNSNDQEIIYSILYEIALFDNDALNIDKYGNLLEIRGDQADE